MATGTCSWSPAIGTVNVNVDGRNVSFEHQARGDEGIILGSVHRVKRTFNLDQPNGVKVQTFVAGQQVGEDRMETIARRGPHNEEWRVAYNRCANDLKTQRNAPPVDFIRAVRSVAKLY
jgi:hypothetical protein